MKKLTILLTAICCGAILKAQSPTPLSGLFSVSESKKVQFAPGNLQYHCKDHTWRLADTQYEMLSVVFSEGADKYCDLYIWSSEINPYGVASTSNNDEFVDWGAVIGEGWYTFSESEIEYLIKNRANAVSLWARGKVNDIKGLILLPDNFGSTTLTTGTSSAYDDNSLSISEWENLEAAGAVFLPACDGQIGGYWASTARGADGAYYLFFYGTFCGTNYWTSTKQNYPVRLVKEYKVTANDTIKVENESPAYTLFYKITSIEEGNRTVSLIPERSEEVDPYQVFPSGDIVIPDSVEDELGNKYAVTAIDARSFYRCYGVTSIVIPNTVKSIGAFAFCYTHITSITIPESVTEINAYIVDGTEITEFNIHRNITYINPEAFVVGTTTLTTFTCDPANSNYCVKDGFVYNKDMTQLVAVPKADYKVLELLPSVKRLSYKLFSNNAHVEKLILPEGFADLTDDLATQLVDTLVVRGHSIPALGDYFTLQYTTCLIVACDKVEDWRTHPRVEKQLPAAEYVVKTDLVGEFMDEITLPAVVNGTVTLTDTTDCNSVTAVATPAEGYEFVQWSDGVLDATRVFEVVSDTLLPVAEFALEDPLIITVPSELEGWYVGRYDGAPSSEELLFRLEYYIADDGLTGEDWTTEQCSTLEVSMAWQSGNASFPNGKVESMQFYGGGLTKSLYIAFMFVNNEHLEKGATWKIYAAPQKGSCTLTDEDLLYEGTFGQNPSTGLVDNQNEGEGCKVILNNQVIIIRNGVRYNALGQAE